MFWSNKTWANLLLASILSSIDLLSSSLICLCCSACKSYCSTNLCCCNANLSKFFFDLTNLFASDIAVFTSIFSIAFAVPSATPSAKVPTSPTASIKLSAISLPDFLILSPVSDNLSSIPCISCCSLLIVSGSLPPKKLSSQANCAFLTPSIIPWIAPTTRLIDMLKAPPKTFCKASKPPVASEALLNTSTNISVICFATIPMAVKAVLTVSAITWFSPNASVSLSTTFITSPNPAAFIARPTPLKPVASFLIPFETPLVDFSISLKDLSDFSLVSEILLPKSFIASTTSWIFASALPVLASNSTITFCAILSLV